MKKKVIGILVMALLIGTSLSVMGTIDNINNESKVYSVIIGPAFSKKLCDFKTIANLTEDEALNLKNQLDNIEDPANFTSEEIFEKKLYLLREHEFLPKNFTLDNLNMDDSPQNNIFQYILFAKALSSLSGNPFIGNITDFKFNLGPHIYAICDTMSRMTFVNILPQWSAKLWSEHWNLSDIIEIPEEWKELTKNISVFSYVDFVPSQVLISSAVNMYLSHSLLENMGEDDFMFDGPFIGIYIPSTSFGIYVYDAGLFNNSDRPRPELPLIDIIIGFSVFSAQFYLETIER